MKKIFYIVVILLAVSFVYNSNGVKKINGSRHTISFIPLKKEMIQNSSLFADNSVSSNSSNEKPETQKSKRVKGIEQTILFISRECSFLDHVTNNKLILFSTTSYYFDLPSCNRKRGPPSILA